MSDAGGREENGRIHDQVTEKAGPPIGDVDTPIPERFGSYRILELISSSRMARVYKAEQETPRRIIALKMPLCGRMLSREVRHRFLREMSLASGVDHSGVVPVFEAGEVEGVPFYTMPFIDGRSLDDFIRVEPTDLARRLILFQKICLLVDALHQKGLIHRDLKPGNLMIDRHGDVRLLDFGLARSTDGDDLNLTGSLCVGTPLFMAPEQTLPGESAITPAADVYSLGVILYWLLTDSLPYHLDGNEYKSLSIIREYIPEAPSRRSPGIPGAYDSLVLACLDKNPAHRPQTAGMLEQELKRIIENPASARVRRKAWPRFRMTKAAAVVSLAALSVLAAAALVHVLRAGTNPSWKLDEVQVASLASPSGSAQIYAGKILGENHPDILEESGGMVHIRSTKEIERINKTIDLNSLAGPHAYLSGVSDIIGDGRDELLVSWSEDDAVHCAVMNQYSFIMRRFVSEGQAARINGNTIARSVMRAWQMLPPAGGQGRRIIAIVESGFGVGPRGILCFDWESEALRWKNLVGPLLLGETIIQRDLDKDGVNDLIVGSGSPGNGAIGEDGTSDMESWIFAWSGKNGALLWRQRLGGTFTQALPLAPVASSGRMLCAWIHGDDYPAGLGQTVLHSLSEGGEILRTYGPVIGSRTCIVHPGSKGCDELALADNEGRLSFIDPATMTLRLQVEILKKDPLWDKVVMIASSADMDGDGEHELVVAAHGQVHVKGDNPGQPWNDPNIIRYEDVHVVVVRSSGAIVARRVFPWGEMRDPNVRIVTGEFSGDHKNEALLVMDKSHLLRLAH